MGHPIMSTKQILFLLVILVVALVSYRYFYEGQRLTFSGFGFSRAKKATLIESNFVKQPKLDKESAIIGEIKLEEVNQSSVVLTLDAKSKVGEVTEMVVWTDKSQVSDWQEYNTMFTLEITAEAHVVYVKFRDDKTYESIAYAISIE